MNKSLRKLISLVCMGIILLELIFLLSDSMETTLLEERKNAYGEWQCAFCDITSEIIENLNANPLIQSVGIIHNSHSVYNEEGKEIGSMGTMDDAAIQLCRITCYEGRLPEQVHEIAMEALMMTRLGITSEIGDPIILYQYGSDGTLYEKTFTLTGILHNYETTSLLSEHTELPGILVSKAEDTDDGIWSAVLLGRSRWKTMQEDLSSMDITNELISNTSTYLEDGVDTTGTMMEWLRLFIILLTFIVLLTVVLSFIHGRKDEWQQWFLLGAELHQIHLYLLEEAILTFLISTAIGLPASLCTFLLYQAISKKLLNNQLVLSFSISHLLLTLLVVAAALILTYAISMAGIGKYNTITDFHDSEKQQGMASRRKKTLSSCIRKHYQQISSTSMSKQSTFTALKPLTILGFWIREWLSGCYLSTFFLILFTAFLTILCLGIHGIQTEWKTLKALEKSYGSSYIFENIEQCDYLGNTASGVYPETLSELNQVMGIQSVESMYRMENALFWANLSSLAEDPYYSIYQSEKQIILQNSIMQDLEYGVNVNHVEKLQEAYQMLENQKMMPLDVWGIDDGVFLEQIKENLDSGSIGTESFLNGDEAILILPAYRELQDDEGTYYYSYFGDIQENSQDQV